MSTGFVRTGTAPSPAYSTTKVSSQPITYAPAAVGHVLRVDAAANTGATGGATTLSIADTFTPGITWHQVLQVTGVSPAGMLTNAVWYGTVTQAASGTVTVSSTAAAFLSVFVQEYIPASASLSVDGTPQSAQYASTSAGTLATGNIAPTGVCGLGVMLHNADEVTVRTVTPNSPWSALASQLSSSGEPGYTFDALNVAAGALDGSVALGSSVDSTPLELLAAGVIAASATYTITGSTSGVAGSPVTLTFTPSTAVNDVLTPSDGAGGTFSPATLTFGLSSTPQTSSYTPAASGTHSITPGSADGFGLSSPFSFTVPLTGGVYFDSFVSGLPSGYASSATVTPFPWNGTSSSTFSGGTYTVGAIEESPHQPGAYSCRIAVAPSALPAGTTPRVAWSVDGVVVVDAALQPPSALLDHGLTPGQVLNQALVMLSDILKGVVPSGATTLYVGGSGTSGNNRIAMPVDGSGNRSTPTHTPPIA